MKQQILLFLTLLCTGLSARANDATCLDNHEDQASNLLRKAIFQNAAAVLAKKGITLDTAKSTFSLTASQVNFNSDGIYGYFSIDDSTLVTKDGTVLTVEYKQQSFDVEDATNAYFKPVLKTAGFDKEGNAIGGHCTLISDEVRVADRAEFIYISNAVTGHFVGRVELPKSVSLY